LSQFNWGNYLLTVIYDLILLESDRAVIFDWKTYLKPIDADKLAKNWQTRLYLYVLAETAAYPLDSLSMTYWFVQLPAAPNKLLLTIIGNYTNRQGAIYAVY